MLQIKHRKVRKGPSYRFYFSIASNCNSKTSGEEVIHFDIDELASVQFKFISNYNSHSVYVSLTKHELGRDSTVRIKMTCGETTLRSLCNWTLLSQRWLTPMRDILLSDLEVNVSVHKVQIVGFAYLFEDTDFTDFKLTAPDGEVDVHKVCLAAHSDYFKRMLIGQWKETINGCIEMAGLNVKNLHNLKEYLYLGILPEDHEELCTLMLLAHQCMIAHLQTECIIKLVQSATARSYFSLHELACTHNIPELSIAINDLIMDDVVSEAYQLKQTKNEK